MAHGGGGVGIHMIIMRLKPHFFIFPRIRAKIFYDSQQPLLASPLTI
eukprot:CAMPEP_0173107754 /NCGR_PEP_ID=MMETSP1102-20130122/42096_1 /TAXON_ID=49646 /ORGANISM="Geminigera sp., Strain Caron Lab Isolate" /LENGTH=46 /DNA_ID= /DNA_START= /DNA_END= /DNA_ORIENTATION=